VNHVPKNASRVAFFSSLLNSVEKQAAELTFKARDLLVRQRTQAICALRGHLAEYVLIAPQGAANLARLKVALEEAGPELPEAVAEIGSELLAHIDALEARIDGLSAWLRADARRDETTRSLMTIPGVGPVCAVALAALAPPTESFSKGRDFAAWIGLVPRQNSTGGKARLGRTSKMGQRDLRRLLIIGATSVVRWRARHGAPAGSGLARMLATKPKMLVAVALANKMARIAWALMRGDGVYEAPATA
jgi:transposase